MTNTPSLPRRSPAAALTRHETYILKDFIGKDEEYIKNGKYGNILVDYETLVSNFELLKKIISIRDIKQINCVDYESALYLEENLDNNVDIALLDDYENKDRSYIDMTKFQKNNFYIPMSYFMWGPKFNDVCGVFPIRAENPTNMTELNGDKILYKETLEKIKEIITGINLQNLTDLDKCMIVSNYLQSKVQYIPDSLEFKTDTKYIIEASKEDVTSKKVGSVNTVLFDNYGLCMAIANATTLLLNNPIFNVNIRSIFGSGHVWNVVSIDGKQYYIDNTWAITRNKNRVPEALKATSFSSDYMLFGTEVASQTGFHESASYIDGTIEKENYTRETIEERKRVLSKKISFSNYDRTLAHNSRVKKDD